MSAKINVGPVFVEHFKTLRDNRTGKISLLDVTAFFAIPVLLGGLGYRDALTIPSDVVTLLVTAFSVFTGLLFSLLVLTHGARINPRATRVPKTAARVVKEAIVNIEYAIIVALLVIGVLLFVAIYFPSSRGSSAALPRLATAIVLPLVWNFAMTLLMIVKRMHSVIWATAGFIDNGADAEPADEVAGEEAHEQPAPAVVGGPSSPSLGIAGV